MIFRQFYSPATGARIPFAQERRAFTSRFRDRGATEKEKAKRKDTAQVKEKRKSKGRERIKNIYIYISKKKKEERSMGEALVERIGGQLFSEDCCPQIHSDHEQRT